MTVQVPEDCPLVGEENGDHEVANEVRKWGTAELLTMVGMAGGFLVWGLSMSSDLGALRQKVTALESSRQEQSVAVRDIVQSNGQDFREVKSTLAQIQSAVARLEGRMVERDRTGAGAERPK